MSEHVVTLKLTAVDAGMLEKILAAKTALDNLKNSKVGEELTQDFTKAGTAAKSFGSETVKSSATANSALKSVEQQLGRTRAAALELSKSSASSLNVATRAHQNFANNTVRSGASIVAQNGKVEGSFDRIGQGINRLGRFAGWAAAIGISGATLLGITQAADGFTNLESKLRTITSSEDQLIRTRQNLFDLSQETRQQVESTATLYTRLTRATEQQNLSDQTRLRLTETINKAFVVSGATTAEATNAIIQLSQGLAAGALRGEEFNSVAEQGPIILDLLSKNLGVTRGELRGMAFDGKLTTEVLINGLLSGSQQVDAAFAKMAITIGGAGTQVGNAFKVWLGETDKAVGGTQLLTSALTALAENFAAVANGVILIAAAFAVKYVAGLVAAQVAQARATAGAIAYTAAQVEGAIAAEAEAAANIVKARAFAGVGGALVSVTAAEQAYATAQLRTVAATEASILANTKNVGVLGRFGSGLLSLVGGPIGIAILAFGALATGTYAVSEATEQREAEFAKSLATTVELTDSTIALNTALMDLAALPPPLADVEEVAAKNNAEIQRQIENIGNLQKQLEIAQQRLESLNSYGGENSSGAIIRTLDKINELKDQIERLEEPLNALKANANITAEEFERRFTPAVQNAVEAIENAITAGSARGIFSGLSSSIKQFVEDVRDIRAGDASFQTLFAEIEQGVEKTADKLKKAGKTASELAVEMVEAARASDTYKKADDNKRESMDKTLDLYVRQTRAIEAAEKAKRNDGKAEAEATRRKREAEAALKAYNKAQQDALRTTIEANASTSASAAIQSEYQLALMDTSIAMMAQLKAGADLTVATAAYDAAVQDATRTRDAATSSLKDELQFADKLVASLDDERAMIGLTADERERHEIITRAMAEAQSLYNETLEETALLSPQELDAINASITALQSRRKEFDENKNSLEALNRIGGGYVESLSETLVDFFGDSKAGFDDLWDSIGDITKRALADLAKQILTSTFFQFLGMGNGSIGNGSFNLASLFGGGGGTGGNGGLSSFMGGGGSASARSLISQACPNMPRRLLRSLAVYLDSATGALATGRRVTGGRSRLRRAWVRRRHRGAWRLAGRVRGRCGRWCRRCGGRCALRRCWGRCCDPCSGLDHRSHCRNRHDYRRQGFWLALSCRIFNVNHWHRSRRRQRCAFCLAS
jgi:tape measure domain-containing protein